MFGVLEILLAIVSIGLFYLALLSPLLCTAYLALVKGKGIRYRWLFPFVIVISVYALTLLLYLGAAIFISPVYSRMLDLAPSYVESGRELPRWMPILDWVITYQWFMVAIFLFTMSVWITQSLWPRWVSRLKTNAL